MLNFFRKAGEEQKEQTIQRKLLEFSDEIAKFAREMKDVREDIERLQIKALETQRVYKTKLSKLVGEEEKSAKEEEGQNIKTTELFKIRGNNGKFL